jgi:hypothetical protein
VLAIDRCVGSVEIVGVGKVLRAEHFVTSLYQELGGLVHACRRELLDDMMDA